MLNKLPISVCLIAKNETDTLRRCLSSVSFAQEIVIVDTGDGTVSKIGEEYQAVCQRFEWIDDFSAARNASLALASQPWILVLDADEIVPNQALSLIERLIRTPQAYTVVTKNYTKESTSSNWFPLSAEDPEATELGFCGWYPSYKVRLFPNGQGLKFTGRVHEVIKTDSESARFFIYHLNEEAKGSQEWKNKKFYYLKLGQMKVADNPREVQPYFELGLQFSELQRPHHALVCYEKVLKLDPNFGDIFYGNAYFEIANIYAAYLKQPEKAIEYFKLSIEKRPEHCPSFYNLACLLQRTGKVEEAYRYYEEAVKLNPHFAVALNNLANLCIDKEDFEKALDFSHRAINLNPLLSTAYQNASYALFCLNRKEEALAVFSRLLEVDPKNSGGAYNLGRLFYKKKDLDNAIKFFLLAKSLDPKKPEAYNHLASIFIENGLLLSAEKMFQEALVQCPTDKDTINNYKTFQTNVLGKKASTEQKIGILCYIWCDAQIPHIYKVVATWKKYIPDIVIVNSSGTPINDPDEIISPNEPHSKADEDFINKIIVERKFAWTLDLSYQIDDSDILEIIERMKTTTDSISATSRPIFLGNYLCDEETEVVVAYNNGHKFSFAANSRPTTKTNIKCNSFHRSTSKEIVLTHGSINYNHSKTAIILIGSDNIDKRLRTIAGTTDIPHDIILLGGQESPYVTHFINETTSSPGQAFSLAAGLLSEYRHVIFMSENVTPTTGWASPLIRHLQKGYETKIVFPLTDDDQPNSIWYTIPDDPIFWERTAKRLKDNALKARIVKTFNPQCFAINVACLEQVGPFDDEMSTYQAEELDYSMRMRNHTILLATGSFVHIKKTETERNWRHLLSKYSEKEINEIYDENRFEANIAIGLAPHPIQEEDIELTKMSFRNEFDVRDFLTTQYLRLSSQLNGGKKDLAIALCDPSMKTIKTSEMFKFTHTETEEGARYIKNLAKRLNVM